MNIERSLNDLRAGRNSQHLSKSEVVQMIIGLEKRLAAVVETIARVSSAPRG